MRAPWGRSSGADTMINVLLVDDHKLVRTGIKTILNDTTGIRIAAEAESGEEAIEQTKKKKLDVVLMDINMPGMGGLEAIIKLLKIKKDLKIIVLSMHIEEPFPSRCLQAGAVGYITKDSGPEEMIAAIKAVHGGGRYIGNDVAQCLAMKYLPGKPASPFDMLSERELQVMLLVVKGKKVQEISDQLCISPKTVNTYRYRLFEKLDVESDVELTHLAMRYGLGDS